MTLDIEKLKKLISEKIAAIKDSIFDRFKRRKIESKARKRGLSPAEIDYAVESVKNQQAAEEVYELMARSLLQLGFYLSPEAEYKKTGMRLGIIIRAMSYEEHQKYCKEAGVLYTKATPEIIKAQKEKEAAAALCLEDGCKKERFSKDYCKDHRISTLPKKS